MSNIAPKRQTNKKARTQIRAQKIWQKICWKINLIFIFPLYVYLRNECDEFLWLKTFNNCCNANTKTRLHSDVVQQGMPFGSHRMPSEYLCLCTHRPVRRLNKHSHLALCERKRWTQTQSKCVRVRMCWYSLCMLHGAGWGCAVCSFEWRSQNAQQSIPSTVRSDSK